MSAVGVIGSGNGEVQMVLVEDQNKVFVAKGWKWAATSPQFDLKSWTDAANNTWTRGKASTDLLAGENLCAGSNQSLVFQPLPKPIVINGVTQHTITIVDRSSAPNTIRLALIGEEYTIAQFKANYPDQAKVLGV